MILCDNINYSSVTVHIPHILQSLNSIEVLNSTSLVEFRDAFRANQMQSKAWLLEQLTEVDRSSNVLVIGSWLGFTSYCLYELGFENITETDVDSRLSIMANSVNAVNRNFVHLTDDVNALDLSRYDLIINTACEHIADNTWFNNIRPGAIVALQSTNLKWHDHVNTADSVDKFKTQYPLKFEYADELVFNDTYSRYMIVGKKI